MSPVSPFVEASRFGYSLTEWAALPSNSRSGAALGLGDLPSSTELWDPLPSTELGDLLASTAVSLTIGDAWRDFERAAREPATTVATAVGKGERVTSVEEGEAAAATNRLIELKVQTAQFAMHLESAWRAGLFQQLDDLVDAENWDFSDELPSLLSYRTFLRLLILLGKPRRPGLGCVQPGNVLATWTVGPNRLTIECQPMDRLKWIVTRYLDTGKVSGAQHCSVSQLPDFLAPYKPEIWFDADRVR